MKIPKKLQKLIEKPVKDLQDLKIRKKLIGTYIIVVLIPIFMVGFILTNGMKNMAIEQAIKEADTNTDRIQIRLNEVLNKVTDISDRIYFNSQSTDILSSFYRSRWEVVKAYLDFNEFNEYKRAYAEIKTIRIYSNNKTLLNNWEFIPSDTKTISMPWYKNALEKNGEIVWQFIWNELYKRNSLCLTRLIKNDINQQLGVLVIELNSAYIESIVSEEPFTTVIAVDDGSITYSNDPTLVGQKVADKNIQFEKEKVHNKLLDISFANDPSKIIINSFLPKMSSSFMNVYTIVPIHAITKKANDISKLGFGIMFISFVISFILLTFFSSVLSRRIIRLRSEMHKAVQGNYDISTEINGLDEIGELHEDLLKMVKSFKQLIYEVYEERLLKEQLSNKQREIEFKMLANQINPHFLYNVLETIRMRAHSKGDEEIAGAVKLLARIMRRNLEVTSKTVTLDSEMDLLTNYLKIQKFRYEDKIDYYIENVADTEDYRMLPLLLQPIVENAFVHGLECKRSQGTIKIRVEELNKVLMITVEDNGVGMDDSKLNRVRKMLDESDDTVKTHIGLQNVSSRIKLYYGCEYGLEIQSSLNVGTKVIMKLPPKEEDACA